MGLGAMLDIDGLPLAEVLGIAVTDSVTESASSRQVLERIRQLHGRLPPLAGLGLAALSSLPAELGGCSHVAVVPGDILARNTCQRLHRSPASLKPGIFWETIGMSGGNSIFSGLMGNGDDGFSPSDLFALTMPPPPERLTPQVFRDAVARTLTRQVKAYDIVDECVRLGLWPQGNDEDPRASKWRYVERRLRHLKLPELVELARKVIDVYDDQALSRLLAMADAGGVRGEMKNLIFAPLGPKPKIVLSDAINNDLQLSDNPGGALVYDRPLAESGLTWRQLVAWRAGSDSLAENEEHAAARELYRRLLKSAANDAERLVFERYCARYRTHGFDVPALIPQVYLHYDPYARRAGGTLTRQRMDFLLLLPRRRRVVIELDGVQHYANDSGRADPARYAAMAAADRDLRLAGYEVYRFGGSEIADREHAPGVLDDFFTRLLAD
jgi:hypothetical protein